MKEKKEKYITLAEYILHGVPEKSIEERIKEREEIKKEVSK